MTTETTELDELTAKMESEETVVCYIIIDNLAEMMQYDSEQYRPAAARIDEIIRDWADEYGGILKEYERDKYIFGKVLSRRADRVQVRHSRPSPCSQSGRHKPSPDNINGCVRHRRELP